MKRRKHMGVATITALVACLFQAQAANYTLTVVGNHHTQAWNRFYEAGVATDHMNTVINTYWNRGIGNALKVAHNEAGFQYFPGARDS